MRRGLPSSPRRRISARSRLRGRSITSGAAPLAYGPIDHQRGPYGYRDARNADGSHTMLVVTNSAAMAHAFWDRRAMEICGGPDFQKNIFRAEIPVVRYTGYASNGYGGGSYTTDQYGDFFLEGYLRCREGDRPSPPAEEGG